MAVEITNLRDYVECTRQITRLNDILIAIESNMDCGSMLPEEMVDGDLRDAYEAVSRCQSSLSTYVETLVVRK